MECCDEDKVLKIPKNWRLFTTTLDGCIDLHDLKQYVKWNDFKCVKLSLLYSLNFHLFHFKRLSSSLFTYKMILCDLLYKVVNYLSYINKNRSVINLNIFFKRKKEERNFKQTSNSKLLEFVSLLYNSPCGLLELVSVPSFMKDSFKRSSKLRCQSIKHSVKTLRTSTR